MKVSKQQIRKWVKALRSGKYTQTKGRLNKGGSFCCLGVACDVFIDKQNLDTIGGEIAGELPTEQTEAPRWLANIDDDFADLAKLELSHLNDGVSVYRLNVLENMGNPDAKPVVDDMTRKDVRFSFDEIADLIEAVFLYEVLS